MTSGSWHQECAVLHVVTVVEVAQIQRGVGRALPAHASSAAVGTATGKVFDGAEVGGWVTIEAGEFLLLHLGASILTGDESALRRNGGVMHAANVGCKALDLHWHTITVRFMVEESVRNLVLSLQR